MKPSPLEFALRLPLPEPSARKWLAGRVLLARELQYMYYSVWLARADFPEFAFDTWDGWCRDAASMSAKDQAQFSQCRLLIEERLTACGNEAALRMMGERPSSLYDLQREWLIELMVRDGMSTNETPATLRRAAKPFRQAKPADANPRQPWTPEPPPKSPSDLDVVFQLKEMIRMAKRLGQDGKVAKGAAMRVLLKDAAIMGNPRRMIQAFEEIAEVCKELKI